MTSATAPTKYFNRILYTDVIPFEVVREISAKTIDIREMTTSVVNPATLLGIGGFAASFANDETYNYESNESHPVVRIRLHSDGWWRCNKGNRYKPSDRPLKVYDRNF